MGLTVSNIKYKNWLDDISYRFSRRRITGIYGNNSKYLLDVINGDISDYDGYIDFEKTNVDSDFFKNNPSSIALIDSFPSFFTTKVSDEFKFVLDVRKYFCDDLVAKEERFLQAVGLDLTILDRDIASLSSSEKYLLSIAINLMYDPEIIMFKDIFVSLDHNAKKKLIVLLNNLKEDKKIVIVSTNDVNTLYEITDEVLLLDGSKEYKSGASDKLFTSIELMRENVINMPSMTQVTYFARNDKKIKLSFHKDVRDIIKDIYKHV